MLQSTPRSERIHIGIFGLRNAGKSSLVNGITNQSLSVVSDVAGTTTDLVAKSMELLPLGPVVIMDTPGLDDEGELGGLRVDKALQAFERCDIAILVVPAIREWNSSEIEILESLKKNKVPFIVARTKADLLPEGSRVLPGPREEKEILVSTVNQTGLNELKDTLGALGGCKKEKRVVGDLLKEGDIVVLVIPVDSSAPKGRIILPQQLVLRDCLDTHASAICVQPKELPSILQNLRTPPRLVITDSQAFKEVSSMVPEDIALTSFSILMARYKGTLDIQMEGVSALTQLQDGDKVLIAEGCTHHRQCEDIGTVKLPRWIKQACSSQPVFDFCSGNEFPSDISAYKLIVHCGGCMLNEKAMGSRAKKALESGIPMANYGMVIASVNGILDRALKPLES